MGGKLWERLWEIVAIAAGDVLGGEAPVTIIILALFAIFSLARWRWNRIKQEKRRVEPIDLIFVGGGGVAIFVAILIAGLVWQGIKSPLQVLSGEMVPKADYDHLKQDLDFLERLIRSDRGLQQKWALQRAEPSILAKVRSLTPADKNELSQKLQVLSNALDSSEAVRSLAWDLKSTDQLKLLEASVHDFEDRVYRAINIRYFQNILTYVVPDASHSSDYEKLATLAHFWGDRNELPPESDRRAAFSSFDQYLSECRQRLGRVHVALETHQ
jgi:hypothetical protein